VEPLKQNKPFKRLQGPGILSLPNSWWRREEMARRHCWLPLLIMKLRLQPGYSTDPRCYTAHQEAKMEAQWRWPLVQAACKVFDFFSEPVPVPGVALFTRQSKGATGP
jgi:hypothetical protein